LDVRNGLAADVIDSVNAPFGRLFIPTGNGSFNATTPYNNTMNYGDDHIRLDLTNPIQAPVTGSQNPPAFLSNCRLSTPSLLPTNPRSTAPTKT